MLFRAAYDIMNTTMMTSARYVLLMWFLISSLGKIGVETVRIGVASLLDIIATNSGMFHVVSMFTKFVQAAMLWSQNDVVDLLALASILEKGRMVR